MSFREKKENGEEDTRAVNCLEPGDISFTIRDLLMSYLALTIAYSSTQDLASEHHQ